MIDLTELKFQFPFTTRIRLARLLLLLYRIFVLVYIAQTNLRWVRTAEFCSLLKHIHDNYPNLPIIIMDMNMEHIKWKLEWGWSEDGVNQSHSTHGQRIIEKQRTHCSDCLDVFSTIAPEVLLTRFADCTASPGICARNHIHEKWKARTYDTQNSIKSVNQVHILVLWIMKKLSWIVVCQAV